MNYELVHCVKHSDQRGFLVEFLKEPELSPHLKKFGQVYVATFEHPGQIRGNHYHTRFEEWFGVVAGVLKVVLEDIKTKERISFVLSAEDKTFPRLHIGTYIAHAFINLSEKAVLLDYTNSVYDPENHDRNPYILAQPGSMSSV